MRIQLQNVGVIKECDVEFVPGICLIVGSSGSGKSTLMRSIYSTVSNEFSDSDISFGSNTMKITITDNGNTVSYIRNIRLPGEKFYYIVNGETYNKVGRTPLKQVTDALKIGAVEVNGEDINFNFNLQFAAPFLILGSQSTLYNVLTYRSEFDISSINDYYKADIKINDSELGSHIKLKERLDDSLKTLLEKEKELSPIEEIYSDYTQYKHKSAILDELLHYLNIKKLLDSENVRLSEFTQLFNDISSVIRKLECLIHISDASFKQKDLLNTKLIINEYSSLLNIYNVISNEFNKIESLDELLILMKDANEVTYKCVTLNECITSCNKLLCKEDFIYCVIKLLHTINNYNSIISVISTTKDLNGESINSISDLIDAENKIRQLNSVNNNIERLNNEIKTVSLSLSEFSVCPLCGGIIHDV